tara:strand:+ start:147638 stop:148396 length:759 start_codon:yes stop_codon:yes gene_type:complete
MKIFILILFFISCSYSVPVHEFFKKGNVAYYQINSTNIFDYFRRKLKWPSNGHAELFESCRKQYTHFGLDLNSDVKVTLFQIKLGLDTTKTQNLDYYCLVNASIAKQFEKIEGKKRIKLQAGLYYHLKWNILDSKLSVFVVEKSLPASSASASLPSGFSFLSLYLSNLETGKKIYFMKTTDRRKATTIHPLLDIKYPVLLDEQNGEYEFALIETNPQFFEEKTRGVFKEFSHIFGIIPDRMAWRGGPIAVMP